MFFIEKVGELGMTILTNLLFPRDDTALLLYCCIWFDAVCPGTFLGRDAHGIVLGAEFEVVFELPLEETARAEVASFVFEGRGGRQLYALRLLKLLH